MFFFLFSNRRFYHWGCVIISILLSYCYPSIFMSLSILFLLILFYLIPWYLYASFFPIFFILLYWMSIHLCIYALSCKYLILVLWCCIYIYLLFTNSFDVLKFTENSKKESPLQVQFVVSFRTLEIGRASCRERV